LKRSFKKVFIIIAGLFALIIGASLIYYFPMLLMDRPETGPIPKTNIFAVKDSVGVFLIKTGNGYIMIDAGLSKKNIENSLKEANIRANDVKWIFLTHSDGDHTAGLPLFPNSNIYMSKDEIPLINGTAKRSFLGNTGLPGGVNIDRIIPLSDGQELPCDGIKVKCILTRGHTIGSMSYLIDDRYLFTGDAFKIKNKNISVHPYSMDKNLSKRTIEQFRQTINNGYIVLTSHYGTHRNN